jgi:hypothetical protein
MKPTLKCKLNYIIKNYFKRQIPSMAEVNNKYIIVDIIMPTSLGLDDFFYKISLRSDCDNIIDYVLAEIPKWSCATCVNQYICKLNGLNNETYTKM